MWRLFTLPRPRTWSALLRFPKRAWPASGRAIACQTPRCHFKVRAITPKIRQISRRSLQCLTSDLPPATHSYVTPQTSGGVLGSVQAPNGVECQTATCDSVPQSISRCMPKAIACHRRQPAPVHMCWQRVNGKAPLITRGSGDMQLHLWSENGADNRFEPGQNRVIPQLVFRQLNVNRYLVSLLLAATPGYD
ncbi:hypothetical protein VFPBJ_00965 [Purpureocillium lilacinum]|uniref:Uncharacterized protein n=1 Tax=Purpureocillium lilacinum TaxID=33203 RepID=A0A179H9I1_PURLI|nr:hypothetical protein VFPBJ_00965 [Purpureocillium lilacinum]